MFNYDLSFKGREINLSLRASSVDSVIEDFNITGPADGVSLLKKLVDFKATPNEVMAKINLFPFIKVVAEVSSSEEVSKEEKKVSEEDTSDSKEEGSDSYVQGFRYSWSLDNHENGDSVKSSSEDEEDNSEEKVGD